MRTATLVGLPALLLLVGCSGTSQTSLNPFNWFGGGDEPPSLAIPVSVDNRPLVAEVTELAVEPVRGGAIVRAVGLPPTQGWWDAQLMPENLFEPEGGELSFRFVLAPPPGPQRQGTPVSREVTAGIFVSDFKLANTRRITVTGADNARTVNRR
jgi:hypothetical protein